MPKYSKLGIIGLLDLHMVYDGLKQGEGVGRGAC